MPGASLIHVQQVNQHTMIPPALVYISILTMPWLILLFITIIIKIGLENIQMCKQKMYDQSCLELLIQALR